jgi:type VI secretion system protein ImpG
MKEDLLAYYERELSFLRQSGAEFATKYPKIAGRLLLHADECEDPHVERLIEAFAFLAARIQCKLDDELPEITESLLGMLYPHYLAPIPSMSIVQFVLDPEQSKLQAGQQIPRGSTLRSRPVGGAPCKFRTCYPVHIWPIEVAYAGFEPSDRTELRGHSVYTMLRMELKIVSGSPLSELREKIGDSEYRMIDHLRFSLQGEGRLAYGLYELLFNNALQVEFRSGRPDKRTAPIVQSPDCLLC